MFSVLKKRIDAQFLDQLPFVVYRKPRSKKVIGIFQKNDTLNIITDFNTTGFVFAPFDTEGDTILIAADEKIVAIEFEPKPFSSSTDFIVDSEQKNYHIKLVTAGITEIKKGVFDKVVLSRQFKFEVIDEPMTLFQRALTKYASAFCYLWYHPKVGTWLGATPEIFLRADNNQFTTMSLAGTQEYQKGKNLVWGQKELEEQDFVTDYIRNTLTDKVSNLQISERETLRAGKLLHIRTKITGLMSADLKEITDLLHPTPAVCGMPMPAAKKFILQFENYDRQFYTGFLGELNFKNAIQRTNNRQNQENRAYRTLKTCSDLYVNLRCMQLVDNHALIYVGGGVTRDSVPEEEWLETVGKSLTMLNLF